MIFYTALILSDFFLIRLNFEIQLIRKISENKVTLLGILFDNGAKMTPKLAPFFSRISLFVEQIKIFNDSFICLFFFVE